MGTTRDDIIAAEQRAVDFAYDCYGKRMAELTGTSVATASASGKDSVANRIAAERQADAYGGLGNEALVIGRVDERQPDGEPQTWYVGRRLVKDDTNEPVVVSWASPLATKWFEALPSAPGDVLLRRRLRCSARVVRDYLDEIATAVPGPRRAGDGEGAGQDDAADVVLEAVDAPEDRSSPATPGDVARLRRRRPPQPDDFLLRELQRSRRGRMRDIVETIRRDQMALVTDSPADVLMVQGGPGTGKSAIGLHRVTWLVHNGHVTAQDVLVVGPHQAFLDYVGQVLPTLGTHGVNAVQHSRLWEGQIAGRDTASARAVKSDERMAAVLRRRVENDCRPDAVDGLTEAPAYEGEEPAFAVAAGSTTLRIPRSELLALVDEARQGDGPYRQRRDRFRSLFVDRLLRELLAIAPRRSRDDGIRRDLERNRRVERLVERVWPSPGAREALRSLYGSPDLLRSCAQGILSAQEQADLHRPRADKAAEEAWTLDDVVCLEELRYLISGETPRRYGHIVIDEAQDLTPMQARSLRRRCAVNGSMTVLGDLAQATGPHGYGDWDRIGAVLSDHGDWRVAELHTSYRVPSEIMDFVAPLAAHVAPGLPFPRAVREAGREAVRTVATEPWKLLADTVAQVTRLLGTTDGRTLRSVAAIVPDDSGWVDEIRRHLDESNGLAEEERRAVSVLCAAQAKGMEYDHVLVVEPATIADRGAAGLRQLYIALTRSTQSLTVLHTSPLPPALTRSMADAQPPEGAPTSASDDGVPEVGTDIRVRVVAHTSGGKYKVEAIEPATERPLLLAVRHGQTPPAAGTVLDTWVLRHNSGVSFVTVDERGRAPITPAMARRYGEALHVVWELTAGKVPEAARLGLSELKGMANRCLRLDQHDWLDLWRVLGSPDRTRLTRLRDLATDANRALKAGSWDPEGFRTQLNRSGWAQPLAAAAQTLEGRLAAAAAPTPEVEPPPPPRPASDQPQPKESAPMETTTTSDHAAARATPGGELLQLLEASAAGDRASNSHEALRHELMAALLRADLLPDSTPVIDVSCATPQGRILYEILGAGLSAYPDLRSGAARLLEINHTLPTPADRLCLVLSDPPAEGWAAEVLRAAFGVHLVWRTATGWEGREVNACLGVH
jgi:DNA helicase IV